MDGWGGSIDSTNEVETTESVDISEPNEVIEPVRMDEPVVPSEPMEIPAPVEPINEISTEGFGDISEKSPALEAMDNIVPNIPEFEPEEPTEVLKLPEEEQYELSDRQEENDLALLEMPEAGDEILEVTEETPEITEASQEVSEIAEAQDGEFENSGAPQEVPEIVEGQEEVPEISEAPQEVSEIVEGQEKTPEISEAPQEVHEVVEGQGEAPEISEAPQGVPEIVEGQEETPEISEASQEVSEIAEVQAETSEITDLPGADSEKPENVYDTAESSEVPEQMEDSGMGDYPYEIINEDKSLEPEASYETYDSQYDTDAGENHFRRDPTEMWITDNRRIDELMEVLRDDLRDKGIEDGQFMEQLINHERIVQMEQLSRYIDGNPENVVDTTPAWQQDPSILERVELNNNSTELQEGENVVGEALEEQVENLTPSDEAITENGIVASVMDSIKPDIPEFEQDLQDVTGELSNETDEIRPIDEVGNWLEEINPNFDPFDLESPYCNNCGSCAYAVYRRLEGDNEICATEENIGYNDQMEALTGMEQVSMSPEEIQKRLIESGDGAHAIIGIDRSEGPGHWFNAANIGGKIVAIDGQSGEVTDWPPDYGDVVNWEMSVKREEL